VYGFSMCVAESDNVSYCIKCAEEIDRYYLAKNICSLCTRLLYKNEIKFVMPSRLYSSYFFDRLPIEHRLMCVSCYRKVEKLNIIRQPLVKIGQIRLRLGRAIGRRYLVRVKQRNS
jgi:hypothetical protein